MKQTNALAVKLKLTLEIKRIERDKYPGYARDMALINDLMLELVGEKLNIEYTGNSAKVI